MTTWSGHANAYLNYLDGSVDGLSAETQRNRQLAAPRPLPLWEYLLVFGGSLAVLAARQPERLLAQDFLGEDGSIFFAQAFNHSAFDALLTRYAGYYHLFPRLIAEAASPLPLVSIPAFFSLSAVTLAAFSISWFYLPHFRHLVQRDWLRLGMVLLILCSPNLEGHSIIGYSQWYLALWGFGVLLMQPVRNHWAGWAITVGYWLAVASAPVLVVLAPLWLVRLGQARSWQPRAQIFTILVVTALALAILLLAPEQSDQVDLMHAPLAEELARALTYKIIIVNLVGLVGAEWLLATFGWSLLYGGASVVGLLLLAVLWMTKDHPHCSLLILLIYVIMASSLLYVARATNYGFPFANQHDVIKRYMARYFLIGSVAFYLFVFVEVDIWLRKPRRRGVLVGCLAGYVVVLSLYAWTFRLPNWGSTDWPAYAWLLDQIEHGPSVGVIKTVDAFETEHTGTSGGQPAGNLSHLNFLPFVFTAPALPRDRRAVVVPLTPPGWSMLLLVPESKTPIFDFPEGLALVGVQRQSNVRSLSLRLFWQPSEGVRMASDSTYVVAVQLDTRQPVEDPPTEVVLDGLGLTTAGATTTNHVLPLSTGEMGAELPLRISLILTQDEQPIQGRTILVETDAPAH